MILKRKFLEFLAITSLVTQIFQTKLIVESFQTKSYNTLKLGKKFKGTALSTEVLHNTNFRNLKNNSQKKVERKINEKLFERSYQYVYLGKKAWYVALYFMLYCAFYVLYLNFEAIIKHKPKNPEGGDEIF
ncbi:uncharacterized protein LOC129614445 [Condylostylus longicornis]|uniref:uncharacterized protein LOC129614445 n=1 Tax=Condylostylus longicornis TaxID=2530218 RepID=UPI00244DD914|nr:uncharacterized protein LOC129614445 [Condylostylus longicornis]